VHILNTPDCAEHGPGQYKTAGKCSAQAVGIITARHADTITGISRQLMTKIWNDNCRPDPFKCPAQRMENCSKSQSARNTRTRSKARPFFQVHTSTGTLAPRAGTGCSIQNCMGADEGKHHWSPYQVLTSNGTLASRAGTGCSAQNSMFGAFIRPFFSCQAEATLPGEVGWHEPEDGVAEMPV